MTLRLYRLFQGLVLLLLGIFLLVKIVSGKLIWYINQRFVPLTVLAVIALAVIGVTLLDEIRRTAGNHGSHHEEHDRPPDEEEAQDGHEHAPSRWRLVLILIPLAIGILVPARPLTADAMNSKGVNASAPALASGSSVVKFDQAADERNILDWLRLFGSNDDPGTYLGHDANVIGFVYHDPRLKDGQFLVSRFALVCCAADAFAVGMVVEWPQSAALPNDQWVKVKGPVEAINLEDQKLPLIQAKSVEPVQIPDQPYLFP